MSIEKKKKQIKKDCLEDESVGSIYLYKLISTNTLDDMLRLLTEEEVYHNSKCIYGKDNFTYSEQLIKTLEHLNLEIILKKKIKKYESSFGYI